MSVFSKIRNFLHRHRNKFLISGVFIAGSIFAAKYAQKKFLEWHERETKEFLDRTRKQQHFESTERTCNQTILSLSATLNEALSKTLNTEEIVAELRNNPSNRVELWEKLKLVVFSRICTLVYVSVMLVVTLRVQLNLVGGYLYKDTKSITSTLQQNYLSMCHSLLETGVQKLSLIVKEKVSEVIGSIDLKKRVNLYDVEQIFWSIQAKLSENNIDPIQNMKNYVISEDIPESAELYDNMVRETADLLESEEVRSLSTTCIHRSFSFVIDKLSEFYSPNGLTDAPSSSTSLDAFLHPSKVQIPFAKLIPILNGFLSKKIFSEALTQQLLMDEKLKILGANIYEVFSN